MASRRRRRPVRQRAVVPASGAAPR
jgi:hypothetical protein